MWVAAGKWLIGTAVGRAVAIGVAVAIAVGLSWWGFSSHYYDKGVAACQATRLADTNAANVAQGDKNIGNNKTSGAVTKAADTAGLKVVTDGEKATEAKKETVRYVYRDPPRTAPIALGSCVHPVDERVQDRIGEARAAAAKARSP